MNLRLESSFDYAARRWLGLDVAGELLKAEAWLEANPTRRKKNLDRFFVNWLNRAHRELLAVELRENMRRAQRRVDAGVGSYESWAKGRT